MSMRERTYHCLVDPFDRVARFCKRRSHRMRIRRHIRNLRHRISAYGEKLRDDTFHSSSRIQPKVLKFVDDDTRSFIYLWSKEREKKKKSRIFNTLNIYFLHAELVYTLLKNIALLSSFQMVLVGLYTYLMYHFDITYKLQSTLIITPLVFPISFLIVADFSRREKALENLATLKGSTYSLFLMSREWGQICGQSFQDIMVFTNKLLQLLFHIKEYLCTDHDEQRASISQVIYEDLSDSSQLICKYMYSTESTGTTLVSRLYCTQKIMIDSFEKLKFIREYKSPRTIKVFTKILLMASPFILAPTFVEFNKRENARNGLAPIFFSIMVAFTFTCLQSVQDCLENPFLGLFKDEIDLEDLLRWCHDSIESACKRSKPRPYFKKPSAVASQDPNYCPKITVDELSDNLDQVNSCILPDDVLVLLVHPKTLMEASNFDFRTMAFAIVDTENTSTDSTRSAPDERAIIV